MLEAVRHGTAVIATPVAAEGMPESDRPAWVSADSLYECGEAVCALLASPERRAELSRAAFAYGETHLSTARFLADLQGVMPGLLSRAARYLTVLSRAASA